MSNRFLLPKVFGSQAFEPDSEYNRHNHFQTFMAGLLVLFRWVLLNQHPVLPSSTVSYFSSSYPFSLLVIISTHWNPSPSPRQFAVNLQFFETSTGCPNKFWWTIIWQKNCNFQILLDHPVCSCHPHCSHCKTWYCHCTATFLPLCMYSHPICL